MDLNKERAGYCELCERFAYDITEHHLIPRTTHSKTSIKKRFSKEERQTTVDFCQPCHKAVHNFFTNIELARDCNSLDVLRAQACIQKHIKWAVKQKPDYRAR